jgi:tetratricopeptide (TPR) repeat protein
MSDLSGDLLVSRVEQLLTNERYRQGLSEIESIRKGKLEKGIQLSLGVLESRCLTALGECDMAFKVAQDAVDLGTELQEYKTVLIDALLEKAAAAWGIGQPATILEACEQAESLRRELQADNESFLESYRAATLYHESIGWYLRDDVHRGIECALQSLKIREQLGDESGVVDSLMRIGYLHIEVDQKKTISYLENGLELNKRLDRKGNIIFAQCCKALVELNKGNWDEAENLTQRSLNLANAHDHGRWMSFILFNLGSISHLKGDFRRAEEFYQKDLDWAEKVGAQVHIALCANNLSDIFIAQGDFDRALKYSEKGIEANRKMSRTKGYIFGLANCGLIRNAVGDPKGALAPLEEGLALAEKQEQAGLLGGVFRSYILLSIVSILVTQDKINEAQQKVERMLRISEETRNNYDAQAYRIAAALVLKSSVLPVNRQMAQKNLTEVLDGGLFDHELVTLSLLHLAELLVSELQMTGEEKVLQELDLRLDKLLTMSSEQNSSLLLVQTLLLQAKVAFLRLEADKASGLLDKARSIAEQNGLRVISKQIVVEKELLLNEFSILEKLGENRPSIEERAETVRIQENIGEMIQQGQWRKMLF